MKQTLTISLLSLTYVLIKNQALIEECDRKGSNASVCLLPSKLNFNQAKTSCNSLGNWAVLFNKLRIPQQQEVDINENLPAWLNIHVRKETYAGWTTLHGVPASNDLHFNKNGGNGTEKCATLQEHDTKLVPLDCKTNRSIGFVCESRGNCSWPLQDNCLRINVSRVEKTIFVGHAPYLSSWTAARAVCIQFGGDLVVPSNHQEVVIIKDFIAKDESNKRGTSKTGFYFTGITKELWSVIDPAGSQIGLSDVSWAPGEPGDHGDCIIATTAGWKATSCISQHTTICQSRTSCEGIVANTAISKVQSNVKECGIADFHGLLWKHLKTHTEYVLRVIDPHMELFKEAAKVTFAILGILCVLALVLLAGGILYCFGKQRHCGEKKKDERRSEETVKETSDNKEVEELLKSQHKSQFDIKTDKSFEMEPKTDI